MIVPRLGRKGGQRPGDFGGHRGVVLHQGHVGLLAGAAGGLTDVRQQEGCHGAAAYPGSVGCGQTTHDGLGDGLWVGLVGNRDGVGHHHSAEQAAPPVGVKNPGRGGWKVRSDRHR